MPQLKNKLLFLNYLEGVPNPNIGGPNHVIYDFINNYKEEKYIFDFLSYGAYIPQLNIQMLKEVNDYKLGIKKITEGMYYQNKLFRSIVSNDFYKPIHFLKHHKFLSRHLLSINYDLIHSHDSISLSFTEHYTNTRRIMTVHHYCPYSTDLTKSIKNKFLKKEIFERLRKRDLISYKLSDIVTFPSHSVKSLYLDALNPDYEKSFKVIYNGIDLERIKSITEINLADFYPTKELKYDFIIFNVASHEKNKKLTLALETVASLVQQHKKNVLFINCGVGSQTQELKNLSVKLDIEKNIVLLGSVPNYQVLSLMKSADYFLHLSEKVVFDLVILEAMACGLCVIASNDGGNKEIITNEQDGYLINSSDSREIAQILVNADKDRIRENALNKIQKFSIDINTRSYINLYDELCSSKN